VPETPEEKAAFMQFHFDTMGDFASAMSKAHGK
jgi:hypothetical protein